jgi:transcriptional regulator with XRE-family HTH domain
MTQNNKFRIALASAKMTSAQFAERHHVSAPSITRVLNGQSKSRRLSRAIDKFIAEEFKKLGISNNSTEGK